MSSTNHMAPWEENAYFELPLPTYPSIPANSQQQLVKANPRRVGLYVGTANFGVGAITISPDNQLVHTVGPNLQGFAISDTYEPLWFHQNEFGVLVQMEWFVANNTAAAGKIALVELVLYRWPQIEKEAETDERFAGFLRSISNADIVPSNTQPINGSVWDQILSGRR